MANKAHDHAGNKAQWALVPAIGFFRMIVILYCLNKVVLWRVRRSGVVVVVGLVSSGYHPASSTHDVAQLQLRLLRMLRLLSQ